MQLQLGSAPSNIKEEELAALIPQPSLQIAKVLWVSNSSSPLHIYQSFNPSTLYHTIPTSNFNDMAISIPKTIHDQSSPDNLSHNESSASSGGPVELIFLGTGTSSSLPHVDCLTSPPDGRKCKTCLSTLTPEGKNNIRRNTSAVVRMNAKDGSGRKV